MMHYGRGDAKKLHDFLAEAAKMWAKEDITLSQAAKDENLKEHLNFRGLDIQDTLQTMLLLESGQSAHNESDEIIEEAETYLCLYRAFCMHEMMMLQFERKMDDNETF